MDVNAIDLTGVTDPALAAELEAAAAENLKRVLRPPPAGRLDGRPGPGPDDRLPGDQDGLAPQGRVARVALRAEVRWRMALQPGFVVGGLGQEPLQQGAQRLDLAPVQVARGVGLGSAQRDPGLGEQAAGPRSQGQPAGTAGGAGDAGCRWPAASSSATIACSDCREMPNCRASSDMVSSGSRGSCMSSPYLRMVRPYGASCWSAPRAARVAAYASRYGIGGFARGVRPHGRRGRGVESIVRESDIQRNISAYAFSEPVRRTGPEKLTNPVMSG